MLSSDIKLSQDLARDRRNLATSILWAAFIAIAAITLAVIGSAVIIYLYKGDQVSGAMAHVEKLVFAILPLFGAWVGTVIAFYFARENFDAAAQNTRALLRDAQGERLAGISAESVMVPVNKMVVRAPPRTTASS